MDYFYPRSPCGERLHYDNYNLHCVEISIHALLAESDLNLTFHKRRRVIFLSTLSLRRATCGCSVRCRYWAYFYPRSPCGERLVVALLAIGRAGYFYPRSPCGERHFAGSAWVPEFPISIHALLAESDARRALGFVDPDISIHALLAESDCSAKITRATQDNFSYILPVQKFLSTLSLRRATAKVHKTVGHFCAYETNFMEIASSC